MRDPVDELRTLEDGMWRRETRGDASWMAAHVTDDFLEFGRSGRTYDRTAVVDVSDVEPFTAELSDIDVSILADDVALLTYRSAFHRGDVGSEFANRSSLWVRTEDGWRMRFHQGTPCPDWR